MEYKEYLLQSISRETDESSIFRLVPADGTLLSFSPGQYVTIKNPQFNLDEEHAFSIASSPLTKDYLEFCIRFSGNWTNQLKELQKNQKLLISSAKGSLILDESLSNIVFLIGGLGISPIMSMLRTYEKIKSQATLKLIYGNRTPELVAYKSELEKLEKSLKDFTIVHVFSDLKEGTLWNGYKGFITTEIIQKEVDLAKKTTFVLVGPTVFINKMTFSLEEIGVQPNDIVTELL